MQAGEAPITLRTVNFLLLSELCSPSPHSTLLSHLVAIATASALTLRHCLRDPHQATQPVTHVIEQVTQAFTNVRLCQLLCARRKADGRGLMEGYWVAVGAVCESVLGQAELEGDSAGLMICNLFSHLIIVSNRLQLHPHRP